MGTGKNTNVNPVFEIQRQPPTEILERVRKILQKKGDFGFRSLHTILNRQDKNKSNNLLRQEFNWALKEIGIEFNKTDSDKIFRYFDKNCEDQV